MRDQTLNHLLKRILIAQRTLHSALPIRKHEPCARLQLRQARNMRLQLCVGKVVQCGLGGRAQHGSGADVELGGRRRAFAFATVVGFGGGGVERGRGCVAVFSFDAGETVVSAVDGGAWGPLPGDVDGGEDELFLLGGGEDLV